ncbi:RNA-binding motif protein, Y chromosome, family 1 member B-like [Hibiscus syriacus]|uniref:RNA-binding motif protein, Y chromosome, family 1 member B-like n=1 Tax=Hibiscus syriacus TaxID=106335 RepID=UPI001923113B|nr:RNA-binding motif protein, Y chromosome, family 1 member B-like [Hibiscus syriacus]
MSEREKNVERENLKGKSVPVECWSVFIDNLSKRVSHRTLRELFLVHGPVTRVFIPSQTRNPKYRFSTFAFVHFKREEDLKRAVEELNGIVIDGRKISVSPARFKDERSRSRVLLSSSNNDVGQFSAESSKSRDRDNINRSRRDDRSYRDALLSNGNRRGNNGLMSEDIQRRTVKGNILRCISQQTAPTG